MNFGARNNPAKNYDKDQMIADSNPEKLEDSSIQNMILNDLSNAFNWVDNRGNAGDNIPNEHLDKFHSAILDNNTEKAIESGVAILETQTHPTAGEIVKSPVKQMVYNVCGKRAYRYELED